MSCMENVEMFRTSQTDKQRKRQPLARLDWFQLSHWKDAPQEGRRGVRNRSMPSPGTHQLGLAAPGVEISPRGLTPSEQSNPTIHWKLGCDG